MHMLIHTYTNAYICSYTGTSTLGAAGSIVVSVGRSGNGNGGGISLSSGDSDLFTGGNVDIQTGNTCTRLYTHTYIHTLMFTRSCL